jgi:hypothetical protein
MEDRLMFQIVCLELNWDGDTFGRRPLQPPYKLMEDAMALAEFDASRCGAITAMTTCVSAGGHATITAGDITSLSKKFHPLLLKITVRQRIPRTHPRSHFLLDNPSIHGRPRPAIAAGQ